MTGGEFSVLLSAVFLFASALLCVVYGVVAGAREAVLSRKEKEQEARWQEEEERIDDELTGGVR